MASGVNKWIGVGNLGADVDVRYAQNGTAVANLRLAVTERVKKGDAWEDKTEWISVSVFGKTAENCGQYLTKGRQVYVEGRLQTREYKDKDGNDRKATEVVAREVLFLGGGNDRTEAGAKAPSGGTNKGGRVPGGGVGPVDRAAQDGFDESLPF